ncbi:hypothetical protein [Microbacterium sp. 1P10AE]|uniref:hypothetical protein n=1 Tax=Microbacterium sp. 1P10AE TaxID=3132286 RepID=UPI00399F9E43
MSINRITLTVPATLGALLMFAGCASSSPTPDASSAGDSPLTPYLSAIYGVDADPTSRNAEFAERQKKSETLVAACMKEKGFEYTPVTDLGSVASGQEQKPDDREWVAQNGYGMLSSLGESTTTDPNADYVESLSESERNAFNEALWGQYATGEVSGQFDPEKAGCQGAAQVEAGQQNPLDSDEFADLRQAFEDLSSEISSLPEQQKADSDWSSCMADAGYPDLKTQSDALMSISTRIGEVNGDGSTLPDESKIAELKKVEIDTALADFDCRAKTDYAERSKKAQWALEEKFVAAHKSELEAAKAAAEQARS